MHKPMIILLLVANLAACGEGKWGAELQLTLVGRGDTKQILSPGDTVTLPGGIWTVTIDRACLAVETAVITPEAGAAPEGGEDCFCHGDPPHCHGDCGEGGSAAERPVVAPLFEVVDLLAGPSSILTRGAGPGDYLKVAFAFSRADAPVDAPAACVDMDGRTFWLQGTLTNTSNGATWPLTVDLRADDKISDVAQADPPAPASAEEPALLDASLRLDIALGHVDFAAVTSDASGPITIGGPTQQHIVAASELFDGLTDGASLSVVAGEAP